MESYNKSFADEDQEEEKPSQVSDETESDVSSSSSEDGFRDVVLEDGNMVNLTRKRSKRTRKLESFTTKKMKITEVEAEAEHEAPHSSASDTTTEEDLAFCLMMLSRDKWKNKSYYYQEEEEEEEEGYKMIKKGRYKCETCGKVFKSYQALGGHRASHKKNRVCNDNVVAVAVTVPIEKRVHQCPICYRVFASGQALGGHKRSHGIGNLSLVNHHHHHQRVIKQRMLDLNLPAPNEEEQVSVVFQ